MIKKITLKDNFRVLAKLLNESFATVAGEFGLTKENSPTNNAFITPEELKSKLIKSREFFCFSENKTTFGFIAIEKSEKEVATYYIEKLAVHPQYRHKGIGKQLMDFAIERIKTVGGKRVSIGIIDSNTRLKEWYSQQGFKEIGVKTFEHLPFNVCFMDKTIVS
jgi:ribosomal protein S18 acetylase RimI-like enzyme